MSERVYTWPEAFREFAEKGIPLGEVFSQRRYIPLREQFIASIFTCAISKGTRRTDWYFKAVEADNTPDFELWCAKEPEKAYKIENVQVPQRALSEDKDISGQVYNFLVNKKLNPKKYNYPRSYILCAYLRFNGLFNFSELHNKFQNSPPPSFGEIWILAATKELSTWHCEVVWPGSQKEKIDLKEEFKKLGKTLIIKSVEKH
ncbi:MAG: hypothetical protein J3T61_03995 [Candidatus Brocadiales bacterium]|nr:hypothetical protein [Candidatus Bathyanammoxibius sp.]